MAKKAFPPAVSPPAPQARPEQSGQAELDSWLDAITTWVRDVAALEPRLRALYAAIPDGPRSPERKEVLRKALMAITQQGASSPKSLLGHAARISDRASDSLHQRIWALMRECDTPHLVAGFRLPSLRKVPTPESNLPAMVGIDQADLPEGHPVRGWPADSLPGQLPDGRPWVALGPWDGTQTTDTLYDLSASNVTHYTRVALAWWANHASNLAARLRDDDLRRAREIQPTPSGEIALLKARVAQLESAARPA